MEDCRTLQDYAYFISRIRYHMKKVKNKNDKAAKYAAVNNAIDECITQNVLADFLKEHRAEVINMSIFEYDEEEAKEVFREDGRIEGILETKIADILELLEDIGEIPENLKEKINSEKDMEILKKMLKAAAKAESIKEFENSIS